MNENQAKKIFEKYNSADAIIPCPKGRAPIRKLLDIYARAAVNLYGIISKTELADIYNHQNSEQIHADEVFTLLLPLVLKNELYCFYKDYIVHYWAMYDFNYADYWLNGQGDKPRFIPDQDEFLKFENQYYKSDIEQSYWDKLRDFIFKEWSDNAQKYDFFNELKNVSEFSSGAQEISKLLEKYGLIFIDGKQAQMFFNLLMEASNNTRLKLNKGYSPNELKKIIESRQTEKGTTELVMQQRKKIGPNAPCHCGSGKKYKKCCRLIETARTAQLTRSECKLFYETWYGLMSFVNEQKKVINKTIKPVYPNQVTDDQVYYVREVLWKNPELIDDYLEAKKLPEEKVELLKSWRNHHKKGTFFVLDYQSEFAIIIGSNEQKEDRLYGIKGISRPMSDVAQCVLPTGIETVLLPFKDKIIYDGFIGTRNIGFREGAKTMFHEMYETALKHGVLTSLE